MIRWITLPGVWQEGVSMKSTPPPTSTLILGFSYGKRGWGVIPNVWMETEALSQKQRTAPWVRCTWIGKCMITYAVTNVVWERHTMPHNSGKCMITYAVTNVVSHTSRLTNHFLLSHGSKSVSTVPTLLGLGIWGQDFPVFCSRDVGWCSLSQLCIEKLRTKWSGGQYGNLNV